MNISEFSEEDQKSLFSQLYHKYEQENLKSETGQKVSKEKGVGKKVIKTNEKKETGPKKVKENKSKKHINDGLDKKVMVDYENGMTQAKIAQKYTLSPYMVSKLIKLNKDKEEEPMPELIEA